MHISEISRLGVVFEVSRPHSCHFAAQIQLLAQVCATLHVLIKLMREDMVQVCEAWLDVGRYGEAWLSMQQVSDPGPASCTGMRDPVCSVQHSLACLYETWWGVVKNEL